MHVLQNGTVSAIPGPILNGHANAKPQLKSAKRPLLEPSGARSAVLSVCQLSELPPALMGMTRNEQDVLRILVGHHNPKLHGDLVFPGPARIAAEIGCGERTVKGVLPKLRLDGFIKTEQGRPGKTGSRCSVHTLQWHAIWSAIDQAKRARKEQQQAPRAGIETANAAASVDLAIGESANAAPSDELSTGESANAALVRVQVLHTIRPKDKDLIKPSVLSPELPGFRREGLLQPLAQNKAENEKSPTVEKSFSWQTDRNDIATPNGFERPEGFEKMSHLVQRVLPENWQRENV